jgi:hypothetical protein
LELETCSTIQILVEKNVTISASDRQEMTPPGVIPHTVRRRSLPIPTSSESTGVRDAVSQQSMNLVMVRILKNKPFQRARRMGIIEWLPFGKVLKVLLLLYMADERERVLQAPGSCN